MLFFALSALLVTATPAEEEVSSPHASVAAFLDAVDRGESSASSYLEVPPRLEARRDELATRLARVLDQRLPDGIAGLSNDRDGNLNDGLSAEVEQIGTIAGDRGRALPVRLVHRDDRWLFSQQTVSRIDAWYAALPGTWVNEHLPDWLLHHTFTGLAYWQLIALPAGIAVAWVIAVLLSKLTRAILLLVAKRSSVTWDDDLVTQLGGPITLAWLVTIAFATKAFAALPAKADTVLTRSLRVLALIALFWAITRAITIFATALASSAWLKTRVAARGLLPIISRVTKVAVLAFALVALLAELGYPVASIIAGLGIGGLAFALAAQKTIENLFGAFAIGADQPFRQGDFVKIDDFVGTIETVGLRSTRVRTLDRTLITLPNGQLADKRIESYTARERMRLFTTIGLVYETTVDQMRVVLKELEATLRAHPKIWPDAVVVRFSSFGPSSLDIEVMAWFVTPDWGEFQIIRQDILLQFMQVVAKAGTSFAFPTQTIHLAQDSVEP